MLKIIFIAVYILQAMISWVPLENHSFYEKKKETLLRYSEIALAVSHATLDPDRNSVFENDAEKIKSALLLASIASSETGFDKGAVTCKISGDNGLAWGPWQTHTPKEKTCSDLNIAAQLALNYIEISFDWCKKLTLKNRLSGYTDGKCRESSESQKKISRALQWFNSHPYDEIIIYE